MGFSIGESEDLIAGLLRKQIQDLNNILRDVEAGKPSKDYAHENLKRVEQQLRWLRKIWFEE